MRAALLVALVVACDTANHGTTHDIQPHRFVEQLTASDHGELIKLEGSVSKVEVHGNHAEPHLSFQLAHGGQTVTVVSKGVVPAMFREGAPAVVLGRWVEMTTKIRGDLNDEDFADVTGPEVFLAREVYAVTPSF